ncbi:hydrogenase nickel incorporation protein HypB [Shewanella sedimentimangrovi]|uniref:Hydrogenase maturation factor HypB n=1 Tax=Shewanella sedimentimangrovi TaxID=2814293 RepID=A0ABX7QXD7_9GAMM|nr:hydrogenase nickel incorporation protein HypB [Shewanella sedimentimangrovi]QSX35635.1 hydrogenase nickel incorporation protein HypB [Shewanella sedimentimangrovi]
MCKDCGCSLTQDSMKDTLRQNPQLQDPKTLSSIHRILARNDSEAVHNRRHFEAGAMSAYNLMSSPGSGKTSLLEYLGQFTPLSFQVIEGDLETSRDADRLLARGIKAVQIQTGSACHLDAFMVHGALHHLEGNQVDITFVENVGNLVCPASYDIGCHRNIVLVSVPEGDDKIAKYPVMFRRADLVLISKCDLLPYFDFSLDEALTSLHAINPKVKVIQISIKDGRGMAELADWLAQDHGQRFADQPNSLQRQGER